VPQALQHSIDDHPCLVFRVANQRRTPIINTQITISALCRRTNSAVEQTFSYYKLKTDVEHIPLFVGAVRVRHVLDSTSPLHGLCSPEAVRELGIVSIQALVFGTEQVYGHVVYAIHVYSSTHIMFGVQFKKVLRVDENGALRVSAPPPSPALAFSHQLPPSLVPRCISTCSTIPSVRTTPPSSADPQWRARQSAGEAPSMVARPSGRATCEGCERASAAVRARSILAPSHLACVGAFARALPTAAGRGQTRSCHPSKGQGQ
jgi:hypothetical protein